MISKGGLALVLTLVIQSVWSQCPAILTQVTYGPTASVTVSAATRATITDPAGAPQDVSF